MKNPFLVGSTVYLRPLEREDAGAVAPWFNDPQTRQYLRRQLPMSVQAEEAHLEKSQGDHGFILGIAVKANDALIGTAGLHSIDWRNRQAGFGISIGAAEQRAKGYGREATSLIAGYAFETLNLNRVWLHVYEDNARAISVYEKVGFRKEGVLRQDSFRDGQYWDTIVMALLREEWSRKPPPGPAGS